MELANALRKGIDSGAGAKDPAIREGAQVLAIGLSLVAPYTAEEMWEKLGHKPSVANAGWPTVDPKLLTQDEVEVVVQINGKIKQRLKVSPDIDNSQLEALAKSDAEISAALAGQTIKKTIVVPAKLVNFVI